nr:unnamed protein product [Digitaria exilis]
MDGKAEARQSGGRPESKRPPPARPRRCRGDVNTPHARGRRGGEVAEEAHVGLRLASSRGGVSRTHSVERPACASRKFPGGWDWRWREDVGGG